MNKLKVIINADDCGRNAIINTKIEECIIKRRLTSTTIMANGDDIEGAKTLFDRYKNEVSFGAHITLDEGKPMTFSQILADNHFIECRNGEWFFTRELWKRKLIVGKLKQAIIDECSAQIDYLLNQGFQLSHFDSHHHVHTAKSMIWLMPVLCKKYRINKYRRIRNCMPHSINFYARQVWKIVEQLLMPKGITTDMFGSFSDIYKRKNLSFLSKAKTLEIMCHPGHPGDAYKEEIHHLLTYDPIIKDYDIELINYNQL